MDKLTMIYDIVRRTENKVDSLGKTVNSLEKQNVKQSICIARNTTDLTEHIEGVKQNRASIAKLNKPLSFIERFGLNDPRVLAAYALLIPAVVTGICSLIVTIKNLL